MEVLVVGDSHLTGRNPIARKDDLVEIQFEKWARIVDIANYNDVPIIQTGDIFNVAVIANSLLTRFGEILSNLSHPLYFVWGNHDLQYHSMDMWQRTSLGVLWKNNNNVRHISDFEYDYGCTGARWAWMDWGDNKPQFNDREHTPYLLTHRAVVNDKQTGANSWILEDENFCTPISKLDSFYLIICGHWHKRYMFTNEGTRILNPGPITRRTVEEWFMPSVTLLDLEDRIMKKIPISDLTPEQVLSRSHIEQRIETLTESVSEFVNQLKHVKVSHKKSFLKTLFHNLDQHELPKQVETLLRSIIADLIEKGAINEV